MSKAFTKEDEGGPDSPRLSWRAPLPAGIPNYVTPRGLASLRAELVALVNERGLLLSSAGATAPDQRRRVEGLDARRRELELRISSAVVVQRHAVVPDEVRFGARIEVRAAEGAVRRFEIVGVDEADAAGGRIAFVAPMARALLGRRVGDTVVVRTPAGDEEWEIVAIAYP